MPEPSIIILPMTEVSKESEIFDRLTKLINEFVFFFFK